MTLFQKVIHGLLLVILLLPLPAGCESSRNGKFSSVESRLLSEAQKIRLTSYQQNIQKIKHAPGNQAMTVADIKSKWQLFAKDFNGSYYIDPLSKKRNSNFKLQTVGFIHLYNKPKLLGSSSNTYLYKKAILEIYCKTNRVGSRSISFYSSSGKLVDAHTSTGFIDEFPMPVKELIRTKYCK
jgi:hypothetical protein